MMQVNLSYERVCVWAWENLQVLPICRVLTQGVYKVNENRFQIHSYGCHEDGIMDYDCLAGWQPPINMSDTSLDRLSTCLVAPQHPFFLVVLPLNCRHKHVGTHACVSTLASPFLQVFFVLYSLLLCKSLPQPDSLPSLSPFHIITDCFFNLLLVFLIFYLHWPNCPM